MPRRDALIAGGRVIPVAHVRWADFTEIEQLRVRVHHDGTVSVAEDINAIEAAMLLKPSVLEGRRMRWHRHVWAFHNIVAHPFMQLLAFVGLHGAALAVHDRTVPRPLPAQSALRPAADAGTTTE